MRGSLVPRAVFFTKGVGRDSEKLTSFEMALRVAGIGCYNLVSVSSILPPKCRIIPRNEGLARLHPGEVVFTVMSRNDANEAHRRISASIGVAIPEDMENEWGYLAEHHSYGESRESAGKYAEKLASDMYKSLAEKPPHRTLNVTETAVVDDGGEWTTVIAVAVFVME
ncbi:MAG: pyruvoyl-dependent arginine decarboxylase [Methanoculleaceae archaeon]